MRQITLSRFGFIGLFILITSYNTSAQTSAAPPTTRSAMLKANESKLSYPLFKGSTNMGVMPVTDVTAPYTNQKTKLVFDMGHPSKDAEKGMTNEGVEEIMRIINLHMAAGVTPENLDAYIVFYGPAANAFLTDEMYQKRFQIANPNLKWVDQLQQKGVKIIVCGQTTALRQLEMSAFPKGITKAFSAITALTDLQNRGHVLFKISEN